MEERFYVGGTIYFIDPEDNGAKYHFYDAMGREIADPKVGDIPCLYSVEGKPSKDKYYVFYNEPMGYWRWGKYGELLGTKKEIGTGRENTRLIVDHVSEKLTLGTGIIVMNRARIHGCADWFIPSQTEANELIRSELANDIFDNEWVWSSSESSAQGAWIWGCYGQVWYANGKSDGYALVGVRAF